jgi:hypothetical protein
MLTDIINFSKFDILLIDDSHLNIVYHEWKWIMSD